MQEVTRIIETFKGVSLLGLDAEGKATRENIKYNGVFYVDTDHVDKFKQFDFLEFLPYTKATYDGKQAQKVVCNNHRFLRDLTSNNSKYPARS